MNHRLLSGIRVFCFAIVLSGMAPSLAHAQSRQKPIAWQQYQQRQIQDSKGFTWGIDGAGGVMSYARAFSSAGQLVVNNSGIGFNRQQSSADGTRYLMSGRAGQIAVERNVKIDQKNGTVRYLDTFTNALPQPQTLAVRITISTRSSNQAVITSEGKLHQGRAFSGPLAEKEVGFVVQTRSSSYPTPVIYLCGPKSKVRPNIVNHSSSNQSFQINYSVTVAAGSSATVMYGLAQRQRLTSIPQKPAVAALFQPFLAKEFTQDIPKDVRRRIVNFVLRGAATGSFGSLIEPLLDLAETHDVERGGNSILVVGEESSVPGELTSGDIAVKTRLGTANIPTSAIAAVSGGGGVGRSPKLYLRSGEVLTGNVDLATVKFDADNGLQFALDAQRILALFTKVNATDGKPGVQRSHWLQSQFGDRIELRPGKESLIKGASVWGPVSVHLDEVKRLSRSEESLPLHRIELLDGSSFWVILQGKTFDVGSKTLGQMSVPMAMIDRIGSVEPPSADEESNETPETSKKPATKTTTPTKQTPTTKSTPGVPNVRIDPPDELTDVFRNRLAASLKTLLDRLAKLDAEATDEPNATQQFDMLSQVADLQARLGENDAALKNIKRAMNLKGLDVKRSSRIPQLMGLEIAVRANMKNEGGDEKTDSTDETNPAPNALDKKTDGSDTSNSFPVWTIKGMEPQVPSMRRAADWYCPLLIVPSAMAENSCRSSSSVQALSRLTSFGWVGLKQYRKSEAGRSDDWLSRNLTAFNIHSSF